MDHEYYQSRLSAFADRELPADEQAQVAEHIEQCDDCARRLAELLNLAELTSRHSKLEETDYWEDAARRIEGQLDGSTYPVTDVTEPRLKRRSGFWWKAPAMAASIVLVGYIGLHESDILTDDIMIPPADQEAPGSPTLDGTTDAVGEEIKAQPGESTAGRPAVTEPLHDDVRVPAVVRQPDQDVRPGRDEAIDMSAVRESEVPPPSDQPPAVVRDAVLPDVTLPIDRLQSEPAEKSEPAAVRTKKTVAVSDGELEESVGRGDSLTDKRRADSEVEGEPELRQLVAPELSVMAAEPVGYADEVDAFWPDDEAALQESFELDNWRHRRDSLVFVISDLEASIPESKTEHSFSQGFTAANTPSRGRAAQAAAARASLSKARAALVEAWCHVCQLSENEAEISRGTGFLRDEAADEQSPHGEQAAACLESLDRQ